MSPSVKNLILITGMSGSGKTTLAKKFEDDGYAVITMGDVIRGLAEERGLEPTLDVLGSLAEELRSEGGNAAVAERCVKWLDGVDERFVIVDGIRSMAEVDVFRKSFRTILISVHASPDTRFQRLIERNRADGSSKYEKFQERDLRELGFNLGTAIALSDHMILNEGPIIELCEKYKALTERLNQG
jgi:dephospho-CoA kinase